VSERRGGRARAPLAPRAASRDAREVARRVIRAVERDGAFTSAVLDRELAAAGLGPADRGLATEIAYGVPRHRVRLDRALAACAERGRLEVNAALTVVARVAAYQLLFLDRVPAHAVLNDAVRAARRVGGPRVAGFVNGLLRRLERDGEPSLPGRDAPLAEQAAVRGSLPAWLVAELEAAVGADELVAAAEAFASPAALAVRVNGLRADVATVMARLAAEGAEAVTVAGRPRALRVTGLGDPAASPSFREGLWTVQDSSAQRVVELVAPQPGERILDACAGVGGKSTYLAELAQGAAAIDAVDVSEAKLARLAATVARLGTPGVGPRCADLRAQLEASYDAVLLDAPCTGLGVLRRHPETKWRLQPAALPAMVALQAELLAAAAAAVRPGGRLIYSVCSFLPAEGQGAIDAFAAAHPELRVTLCETAWPHRDGGDGFFLARLCRDR
jgi:16S rRNA (cytosine967-C5)-methyltransferase